MSPNPPYDPSLDETTERLPAPAPAPRVPPPLPPALSFVPFADPQAGTFSVEVPRGWRVTGGLVRPGLGDRRAFVAARSPDGIEVLYGDPECPQAFHHTIGAFPGIAVTYPTGCVFVNLPPSGEALATHWLKTVAPRRFGRVEPLERRDRPDLIQRALAKARSAGVAVPPTIRITAHEARFRAGARVGSCVAATLCDVSHEFVALLTGTSWEGNVVVWTAPPHLASRAEEVALRMIDTFRRTPRFQSIVADDEARIAANGQTANRNQQIWFQGQQAAHQAQVAQGDALVQGYWEQQASNERAMEGWSRQQSAYDAVSQAWSDNMRGDQRLYDDAAGKQYHVPEGAANYYWVDPTTDKVYGTDTYAPPDYERNYVLLRKP